MYLLFYYHLEKYGTDRIESNLFFLINPFCYRLFFHFSVWYLLISFLALLRTYLLIFIGIEPLDKDLHPILFHFPEFLYVTDYSKISPVHLWISLLQIILLLRFFHHIKFSSSELRFVQYQISTFSDRPSGDILKWVVTNVMILYNLKKSVPI